MEKTLLQWKASNLKQQSKGRGWFVIGSIFFIFTIAAGPVGFILACIFIGILAWPKKCRITSEKVQFWFKKYPWSKVDRVVWEGPRAKIYKSKHMHFVLPVEEELVPKVKKIFAQKD